jgi:hypothetical protein
MELKECSAKVAAVHRPGGGSRSWFEKWRRWWSNLCRKEPWPQKSSVSPYEKRNARGRLAKVEIAMGDMEIDRIKISLHQPRTTTRKLLQ